jgi:hypothetical protein
MLVAALAITASPQGARAEEGLNRRQAALKRFLDRSLLFSWTVFDLVKGAAYFPMTWSGEPTFGWRTDGADITFEFQRWGIDAARKKMTLAFTVGDDGGLTVEVQPAFSGEQPFKVVDVAKGMLVSWIQKVQDDASAPEWLARKVGGGALKLTDNRILVNVGLNAGWYVLGGYRDCMGTKPVIVSGPEPSKKAPPEKESPQKEPPKKEPEPERGTDSDAQASGAQASGAQPSVPPIDPSPVLPVDLLKGPVAEPSGGYCYRGPHPDGTGVWESANGEPHLHEYGPFDPHLFVRVDGCYVFIGDPRDFNFTGPLYYFAGPHPIASANGESAWCFIGYRHAHVWPPTGAYRMVGGFAAWVGPYDANFASAWFYYSAYFSSQYPTYYRGGQYQRTQAIPQFPAAVGAAWRPVLQERRAFPSMPAASPGSPIGRGQAPAWNSRAVGAAPPGYLPPRPGSPRYAPARGPGQLPSQPGYSPPRTTNAPYRGPAVRPAPATRMPPPAGFPQRSAPPASRLVSPGPRAPAPQPQRGQRRP